MADVQLSEDEFQLMCLLPENGDTEGNGALRARLGWPRTRYARAREGLLDKQLVIKGVGRGGTLRRTAPGDDNISEPGPEPALYASLRDTLETAWSENRGLRPLACETTAFGGRRRTGGRWTRPDLVVVGFRHFELVPPRFELITFEVKKVTNVDVLAVYEALSHSRAATHAYTLFQIPDAVLDAKADQLNAVVSVAAEHGIGVITAEDLSDFETWDERQPADFLSSDPIRMNAFLQEQLSIEGQQAVAAAL
ncbi:MAG: hypothetical protein INR66_09690 [Gordonia polyisoprenivorans]|nr:hypothetical protein [Gordonia polyisoprenivorans]